MPAWNESDDMFLRQHYPNNTVKQLTEWLTHSEDAIESRVKFLKIAKEKRKANKSRRCWTHGEIIALKLRMRDKNKDIAREMKRSTNSVRKMKERLRRGLSFPVNDPIYKYSSRNYRHVVEETIGRKLNSDEHVHHIDVNSKNNNITNLHVCSPEEHGRIHAQLDNLLYNLTRTLLHSDVIEFKDGKYAFGRNYSLLHLIEIKNIEKQKCEREGRTWTNYCH
jgi:hypothetical protein